MTIRFLPVCDSLAGLKVAVTVTGSKSASCEKERKERSDNTAVPKTDPFLIAEIGGKNRGESPQTPKGASVVYGINSFTNNNAADFYGQRRFVM